MEKFFLQYTNNVDQTEDEHQQKVLEFARTEQ